MRNITLSASEEVIERARAVAREHHTTLNQMFRDWLETVDHGTKRIGGYRGLMQRVGEKVDVGRQKFTREEMNER
jgi:ABC-type phosphonate transport system ATPase subunit